MFDTINNNNESRQQFLKDRKLELDKILKIKSSLLQELCKQEAQIINLYPRITNNGGSHFNPICDIHPTGETIAFHKLVSSPSLHGKNLNNNFEDDETKRRLYLNDQMQEKVYEVSPKLDNEHYQHCQFIYPRCRDDIPPPPPLQPIQDKLLKKKKSINQLYKQTTTTSGDDMNNSCDAHHRNNLHQSSRININLSSSTSTNSVDMKKISMNEQDQEKFNINDNNNIIIGNISPSTFNCIPPLKNNNINYFIKPAEVSSTITIRNNSFYKKSDLQVLKQHQQHPYQSPTHQCYHYSPNPSDVFNHSSNTLQFPSVTDDLINRNGGGGRGRGDGIEDNVCLNKSYSHQQNSSSSTPSLFVDDIKAGYPQLNHGTDQLNPVIMNLSMPSEIESTKTSPNYNNNNNNNSSPINLDCLSKYDISSNTNSNSSIVDNLISQYGSNNFSIMTNNLINKENPSSSPTRTRQLPMVTSQNQQYGNGIGQQHLPYHYNFGSKITNRTDGINLNNVDGNFYQQRHNQETQGLGGNWITTDTDERIWCPSESRSMASLTKPQIKSIPLVTAHQQHQQQQQQQQQYASSFSSQLQANLSNFDSSQKMNKLLLSPTSSSSSSICGGISSGDISNKKYKEKQWMETSLDGPTIAIKCKFTPSQTTEYHEVAYNSSFGSKSTTPLPTLVTAKKNTSCLLAPPHSPSPPLVYPTISLKKKLSSHSMHQLSPRMVKQQLLGHQYNNYYQHSSDHQILQKSSSSDLITPIDVQIPLLQSPNQTHSTNMFSNFSTIPLNSPISRKDNIISNTMNVTNITTSPSITDAGSNELSGKNMTIVQEAKFQPYTEETKPFEMSDFYKYSIKFRQKLNSNNVNNILE